MIRLVCFDLGGVIVRICRSWTEGCQAAGLDVRGDVDPLSLPSDGWRRVEAAYQTGRIDGRTYAQRCSALVDGLYSPEEIRRIYDAWILGEYDGVEQMILRIHEAGVHTAVLSNTSHEHWLHMRQYPAFRQLRNKHGSHQLRVRKPDEAAYGALEKSTGCRGGEILFFDDTVENVAAARRLGWTAEHVDPLRSTSALMTEALIRHGLLH